MKDKLAGTNPFHKIRLP